MVVLAYAAIVALEVPRMLRKKQRGELVAFSVILAVAFVLSMLLTLGVRVPSPTKGIEAIFKPLGEMLLK